MKNNPRRRKKSAGARLRPFWILIVLLVVAAAIGAYYAATWPGFFVRHLSVRGNHVVSADEILARAAIARRKNIWLQDMKTASARVEAIPYIDVAVIHRMPPANVTIDVTERAPFAHLRDGADQFIIDKSMRVLQASPNRSNELPLLVLSKSEPLHAGAWVRSEDAQNLAGDYIRLSNQRIPVRAVAFDKYGGLVATLRSGITVQFGDDADLEKKSALIDPILSQLEPQRRPVKSLDLRAPATPVVVYRK